MFQEKLYLHDKRIDAFFTVKNYFGITYASYVNKLWRSLYVNQSKNMY